MGTCWDLKFASPRESGEREGPWSKRYAASEAECYLF